MGFCQKIAKHLRSFSQCPRGVGVGQKICQNHKPGRDFQFYHWIYVFKFFGSKRPPTFFRVFHHWILVFKFRAPNFGHHCRPDCRPDLFSLDLGHHCIYYLKILSLHFLRLSNNCHVIICVWPFRCQNMISFPRDGRYLSTPSACLSISMTRPARKLRSDQRYDLQL